MSNIFVIRISKTEFLGPKEPTTFLAEAKKFNDLEALTKAFPKEAIGASEYAHADGRYSPLRHLFAADLTTPTE